MVCSVCKTKRGPFAATPVITKLPTKPRPSARWVTIYNGITGENPIDVIPIDVTFPLELPHSPCFLSELIKMLLEVFHFRLDETTVVYTKDNKLVAREDVLLSDCPGDPTNHVQLVLYKVDHYENTSFRASKARTSPDPEVDGETEDVLLCKQCYQVVKGKHPFKIPSGASSSA